MAFAQNVNIRGQSSNHTADSVGTDIYGDIMMLHNDSADCLIFIITDFTFSLITDLLVVNSQRLTMKLWHLF